VLRTPDDRFGELPGYPYQPRYVEALAGFEGLRLHSRRLRTSVREVPARADASRSRRLRQTGASTTEDDRILRELRADHDFGGVEELK
jgi:hypothetical protein